MKKMNPLSEIINNVSSSVSCVFNRNNSETSGIARTAFNEIFLVFDTIFYQKTLELKKYYHQKLILPKELNEFI